MPEPRYGNTLTVPAFNQGDGSISPRSNNSLTSPNTGGGIRRKLVVIGDGACANIPVDNHTVEMSLWDTAGQEDYDRIRPLSYTETSVLLICFAIDMPTSLASVTNKWIDEVVRYCEGVPRILVGCKMDIRQTSTDPSELVSREQAMAIAEKIQAYKYLECSAKSGEGLKEVFEQAARASLLSKKKFRKAQKLSGSVPLKKPSKKFCAIS